MHVYLGLTDHARARDEIVFMFISKSDYGGCFPILHSAYPFLKYDSYISCGSLIFYSRPFMRGARAQTVGAISPADLAALRNHLIDHDYMVAWQIKVACNALKAFAPPP